MAEVTNLTAGDNATPRLRMSEIGHTGLREINGYIVEQARAELRWPRANNTYREMADDATIASALSLIELMIARVKWSVGTDPDASSDTLRKAAFLKSTMGDMEHSWLSFIKEVSSAFTYGYCINEKVYRKRLKRNGSRYNDGLIGIRKLPVRSQTSIYKWEYSPDGRDLTGVTQNLSWIQSGGAVGQSGLITIPRNQFLLFRADATRDNPEGTSPLSKVYLAWRIRKEIEQYEAIGVSRNMNGLPVLSIPPAYMSADATEEEKAIKCRWHY